MPTCSIEMRLSRPGQQRPGRARTQHLDERGRLATFQQAFREASSLEWAQERDAYLFHRDEVITAWSAATGQSTDAAPRRARPTRHFSAGFSRGQQPGMG